MATDRIGVGHGGGEVAGTLMSSGSKRKVEELGGHVVSAVVGGMVDWSMSAVVARYEARTSVDDQLDRLSTLAMMVHSAVEAAEGVHIRNWWLRRWLWKLRDAALEGDEVLRLFRQRRKPEETDAASRQATRNMLWRALRSAKSLLFGRGDDGAGVERLSRVVARLEREAVGLDDFLKMLELEIRRPPPVKSAPPPPVDVFRSQHGSGAARLLPSQPCRVTASEGEQEDSGDGSRFDHGLSSISHEEYVAGVWNMGLLILRRRIRRVLDWLIRKKPVAPLASRALNLADTDRLREHFRLSAPSTGRANLYCSFRRVTYSPREME